MNRFERRYLGASPYRLRKEDSEIQKLHRDLLVAGIFLTFALAFFIDTIGGARVDFLIAEAQAAERPMTEEEVCADLSRYTNGSDYATYCETI